MTSSSERLYPLSSVQREIWFNQMLHPQAPIYNLGGYLRIRGPLDPQRFEQALKNVIRRNDALRTILHETDSVPRQGFSRCIDFKLAYHDLCGRRDPEVQALGWMRRRLTTPLQLFGKHLFSFALIKISTGCHFWFFVYHHLITDAFSLSLTARYVAEQYNCRDGDVPEKKPPSYIDFIEDDKIYLESQRYRKDAQYWTEKFKSPPRPLFRRHYAEPDRKQYRPGGRSEFWLKRSIFNRLEEVARENRGSAFHMLLGLLYLYFIRLNQGEEVVIGIPLLNRSAKQFKETLGVMTSLIPLRLCLGQELTFRELIHSVGSELRKNYRHQRFPSSRINRRAGPTTKYGEQIVDLILSFTPYNLDAHLHGAPADLIGLVHEYQEGSLSFFILEADRQSDVQVHLKYSQEVFKAEEIEYLCRRLLYLLEQIAAHPDRRLKDFNLLPPREYRRILHAFNAADADDPRTQSIAHLFEQQVRKTPGAIAVVCINGEGEPFSESRLTYGELNRRANHLARILKEDYRLEREEIVGILMDNSEQVCVAMLGILKAGGAYMPIDPAYPETRVRYMLTDAACRLVVADTDQRPRLADISGLTAIDARCRGQGEIPNPVDCTTGENLAYLIYTSGSTGRPKGSLIEQRAIARLVRNTNYIALDETCRILQTGSPAFDAATFEFWGALLNGGRLYLPPKENVPDPGYLRRVINTCHITTLWLTAGLFNQLVDLDAKIFNGLKQLLVGGERLSIPHVNRIRAVYPDMEIINGYGPTENTTFTACYSIRQQFSHDIPIGGPIAATRIYILDGDDRPVPIGVEGELCVGGDGLARGYINRPKETAEKFRPNPFEAGKRMYRTGDKGYWLADGTIAFIGRDDDQVKVRGFRIEPGEIENCLREHPAVHQAVVTARDFSNSGRIELAAYVTGGNTLDAGQVRSYLQTVLPAYMIPAAIIPLKKFPLTPNGKVDRKALPHPLDAGRAPLPNRSAPMGGIESILADIWKEVLHLSSVAREDNFFELGGESLKAVLVSARIHAKLGVKLKLSDFFAAPSIAAQAREIRKEQPDHLIPIRAAEAAESYPVSHAQWRLWVLDKLDGGNVAYNMPLAFRIHGPLDRGALESSCRELIRRHESLRTLFLTVDGSVRQKIPDEVRFTIGYKDLTPKRDPEQEALALARREALAPFDLKKPPLMRLTLLKLHAGEERSAHIHVMLFTIHHIIADEWSLYILFQELGRAYARHCSGGTGATAQIPAEAHRIHYKDYALWHRRLLKSDDTATLRRFWRARLSPPLPVMDLPLDFPRPPVRSFAGDMETFPIPASITAQLDTFCNQRGLSRFMLLLAVVKVLLFRYTGSRDIITGTPVAGRDHPEIQNLVGFFVNTLALRDRMDGKIPFDRFAADVRQTVLEAFDHQRYPFDRMVEELDIPRDSGRSPLFDVMVTLRNNANLQIDLPGTRIRPFDHQYRIAKFDLTFSFVREEERLLLEIEYSTTLFTPARIQRMGEHFGTLLEQGLTRPDRAIGEMAMLSREERLKVRDHFNATAAAYPRDKTLPELFAAQVQETPHRPAVTLGREHLSYAQVNARADTVARCLAGFRSGGENAPVAVLMDRTPDIICAFLGVLKAGCAYVPIDPDHPGERIRFMLADADCRIVLTRKKYLQLPLLKRLESDPNRRVIDMDTLPQGGDDVSPAKITPDQAAYIIYTSGSTGRPKGCVVTHRNVVRLIRNSRFPFNFNHHDIWSAAHSFCFDFSVWEMYGALLYGGRLVIAEAEEVRNAQAFLDFIRRHKITVLNQTPAAFYQLMQVEGASDRHDLDRHLRYVIFGGDRLDPAALQPWVRRYPLSAVTLVNMYGITETTVHVTHAPLAYGDVFNRGGKSPIGRPLPETRVYVCDETLQLCPIGIPGELYVGGSGVCRGYLNRPELNAHRFIEAPFNKSERVYRTGDLGCWREDGSLEYLGRNDDQVQIRGYRIEPGEIQSHLIRYGPVKEAVLTTRTAVGRGFEELLAYLTSDEDLEIESLRAYLRKKLPAYMLPAAFIQVDKIPLTSNGKVDKKALTGGRRLNNGSGGRPGTALEKRLLRIWRNCLKENQIGMNDNFFEVGGNSLLLVKVCAEINRIGSRQLEVTDLFTHTTISDLAAFIEKRDSEHNALQTARQRAAQRKEALNFNHGAPHPYPLKSEVKAASPKP